MTIDLKRPAAATAQPALDETLLAVLPPQGGWSEEWYLWLTNQTNRLIEYTDGWLEVLPMPTDEHQTRVLDTRDLFRDRLGPNAKILVAPLRVRIRPGKFREPDIVVLLDRRDPRRQNQFWQGADIVVEVVSADRPERDLVDKVTDYAEAGIKEYWIVNPLDRSITVLRLDGDRYVEHGVFRTGQTATSALVPDLTIPVDAVFADD